MIAHDTELIRKTNTYQGQTIYVGLDSPELKNVKLHPASSEFDYKNHHYKLNVEGEHNIQNSLFVINSALKLGLNPEKIADGLESYKPIEKRWQLSRIAGFTVVDDSYNSNPDSLRAGN